MSLDLVLAVLSLLLGLRIGVPIVEIVFSLDLGWICCCGVGLLVDACGLNCRRPMPSTRLGT